jgi:dTDP-4-amino-4,6-dideoxygalactose transaminase
MAGSVPPLRVPFNRPYATGREAIHIREAIANRHLSGNGAFTIRAQSWLEQRTGARRVLLTQSCTVALEMAALVAGVGPGDEVIMPSFTFVSTANAFVLRGATPVFVDIRPDTLNLDERLIESAITRRTKAIVPVHYAGIGCEMDAILEIAGRAGLLVIEDAAQGLLATCNGRPLGGFGALGAISFHETKNISTGEGGAILINDERLIARAEIAWQKGTDRNQFERGEIRQYSWVDLGSSYLPSEVTAAFLWAQLEAADAIVDSRIAVWNRYQAAFEDLEYEGRLKRPTVPLQCAGNGHLYYLILPDAATRDDVLESLNAEEINAVFHYVPLHSSRAGRKFGRTPAALPVTDRAAERLIRLPMWTMMPADAVERVIDVTRRTVRASCPAGALAGAG